MKAIPFQAQYDRKTFFRAVRVANAPRRGGRITFWLSLGAFFALSWLAVRNWLAARDFSAVAMYILLALILLAFILQGLLPPWLAARKMWRNPRLHRPMRGQADGRGLVYILPEGRQVYAWARFIRLRRAPDLLTLVTREGLLLIFTPRYFKKSADWQRFVRLVQEHVISTQ